MCVFLISNSKPALPWQDGLRSNAAELYEDYRAFVSLFGSLQPVDRIILELCRLRVKQLLGEDGGVHTPDRVADANGPGADKLRALENWRTEGAFSEAERACLSLAEKFVLDPYGVTDKDIATVVPTPDWPAAGATKSP